MQQIKSAPHFVSVCKPSNKYGLGSGPLPKRYVVLSGVIVFSYTIILGCSWSVDAGTFSARTFRKSAVAAGPIPPRTPNVLSVCIVLANVTNKLH